ncbi:MAG: glycerophosphodiester phosphodiesterase [Vulcanisaeta sp.]|nr:glycerophosphodiester phosphodiesterase [Vulcanisaeta sp.]MCG2892577.1 glycerophosphodiester phosphodiesterase [Vulcanisaeta sp.]
MVLVFGHRGAMGYAPENTIPSFRLAVEMGVDGVELDVHMTRDGEVVVIHDFTVDRTTNGHGYVKDLTLEEIKRLDAGVKFGSRWRGVPVPTLEEVFREFGKRIKYKIEIKRGSDYYPGIERKVVELIRRYNVDAQVISFDYDALSNVRAIDRDIEIGIIFIGKISWFIDVAKKLNAHWLHVSHELIDERGVELAHKLGLKVGAWTVNDEKRARYLIDIGVDDITSNYPDRILRVTRARKVV